MNTETASRLQLLTASATKGVFYCGRKGYAKKLFLGLVLVVGFSELHLVRADSTRQDAMQVQSALARTTEASVSTRKRANFRDVAVSLPAWHAANWVVDSGDNDGMPFMIVDKVQAKVLMFDSNGQLSGATPVLLGLAVGDDSVSGIGERALSNIRPEERITPAGRFVASLGRNLAGKEVLWVDYASAISLHRVVTDNVRERRAERLSSPYVEDNRISYGCINVPVAFFEGVVVPAFTGTNGIVYTLPETRDNRRVFDAYYEFAIE